MLPDGTMRFGSTAKVLLKCKLKYYRISECDGGPLPDAFDMFSTIVPEFHAETLHAACAVDALCNVGAIDTLLSNFILPLQGSEVATRDVQGKPNRIHCSLNINTETGRLSARRPNLQNQPAMEKDRYKVCSLDPGAVVYVGQSHAQLSLSIAASSLVASAAYGKLSFGIVKGQPCMLALQTMRFAVYE